MMNVLGAALKILPQQKIIYKKFLGKTVNELGIAVNSYGEPITALGSIQPANDDTLYKLGIADGGDYYVCYLHGNALSISSMQSNDIVVSADGTVFNIFKSDKWSMYPGQDWNRIVLQRAKNYGE